VPRAGKIYQKLYLKGLSKMKREWLKEIRKNKNFKQYQIASKVGIDRVYWSFIENGVKHPSIRLAIKIANLLDFDWKRFYS